MKKIQIKPFILNYFKTTLPTDVLRYMLKFCNKYIHITEYTYKYKQNRKDKQYIYGINYQTKQSIR